MSKNVEVLSHEALECLIGIIKQMVTLPKEVIDNLNLSDITTFSSTKIDALLTQTLTDANTHAEELCSTLTKLTCEKTTIQPTLENSKINIIYLYSADGTAPFQQYLKINTTELIDMGSTDIGLDEYLTITEAVKTYCTITDYETLKNEVVAVKNTIGTETLATTATTLKGAINELESKHYLEVFDLQGASVLDYAKTFEALTHNYFYANNCTDLPNSTNYGYCSVDVSQDPLYRDITFYCPTTGRIYVNTIGADPDDATVFGTWSGWHEFLMKEDIVTTIDSTVTDTQVPSAKVTHNELSKKVDKTSITTVLDDTVTDEQVPSAKALYDVWGEWSVISPIKEGQVRNSNGGGVSYYKQIKDMVIVTCSNVSRLIYTWNIGASINEGGALPKPRIKIPVSIMSSNGEFYLAELDTDGYIKVKNREIPKTETGNIYYYSFNYITDEL